MPLCEACEEKKIDAMHHLRAKPCIASIFSLQRLHREACMASANCSLGNLPPCSFITSCLNFQQVLRLRTMLDEAHVTCWLDVGQMGGGDQLYSRIYSGVNNCQLFLACISPKYVCSESCKKELTLADLMKKPIIPIMMESMKWPLPGAVGLILAPLVYVDLAGSGGHGGVGKHADWRRRVEDLIVRIQSYVNVLPAKRPLSPLLVAKPESAASVAEVGGRMSSSSSSSDASSDSTASRHLATPPPAWTVQPAPAQDAPQPERSNCAWPMDGSGRRYCAPKCCLM